MKKGKFTLMGIISAAAVIASSTACAEGPWYVSLSAGSADYGRQVDDFASELSAELTAAGAPNSTTSSKTATGYNLDAGYNFNKYFALEGGYFNMGSATVDGIALPPASGQFHLDLKLNGWEVNGVGTLPLTENWGLFASGGLVAASVKSDFSVFGPGGSTAQSESANNTTFDYGVGVRYDTGAHWGLRAGFKQYHDVGDDNTTGKGNVNFLYVSASYNF
jgi:OOP family OmpA-OmpF porin